MLALVTRLSCGVPQGSVLGPSFFSLSTLMEPGVYFHSYVGDIQIYVLLKKNDTSLKCCLGCLGDINDWMALNLIHFNDRKMELMVFGGTTSTSSVDQCVLAQ